MSKDNALTHIVIVGGGSAGWMTAAALANTLKDSCKITLVESDLIGTVGVGEATIPPIKLFNQRLGIDENTFLKRTKGTFKLGIQFVNWTNEGHQYFHPFGQYAADFDAVPLHHHWIKAAKQGQAQPLDEYSMAWHAARAGKFCPPSKDPRMIHSTFDYAYHFDAGLYAELLREYSEQRGVERIEGKVTDVVVDAENEFIREISVDDGTEISGDLFIDCSGFRGVLIEQVLQTGYQDWSHWLPCDSAVAVQSELAEAPIPYTRSTALKAGWQWRIPLQHRNGNGYVYCSKYISDEEARTTLLANLDGKAIGEPKQLRFNTGHRNKFWNGNCVAIGLSAGFMEPLESTSLHMIQTAVTRLLALLPDKECNPLQAQEFNRLTQLEYEGIRDFLILHYHANHRRDPLWQACKDMDIPASLQYKMDHFLELGNLVSESAELFRNSNWFAVLAGQCGVPKSYAPMIDLRNQVNGKEKLDIYLNAMQQAAVQMPTHAEYIEKFCKSS